MSRHPQQIIRDCANNLALTVSELMSIAKTAPKRYYVWEIPKRSGRGMRTVCHPARELKAVQYYFLDNILSDLLVHDSATAYVTGSSIRKNADAHIRSRVIMKLDFADFFNSLKVANWRQYAGQHFSDWSQDELDFSCRMLFWGAGGYNPRCLAIGAPTSPMLSNALMYEVDVKLSEYADAYNIKYTRYADDITFSSPEFLDYGKTLNAVKDALRLARNTSILINENKTILVSQKKSRRVTGLVITPDNKVSLGRDRKRLISAMIHRTNYEVLAPADMLKLAGLLAFATDAEPSFVERLCVKYSPDLIQRIMSHGGGAFST